MSCASKIEVRIFQIVSDRLDLQSTSRAAAAAAGRRSSDWESRVTTLRAGARAANRRVDATRRRWQRPRKDEL